nr:unnamed protein product [Callosobruchus chinensis]
MIAHCTPAELLGHFQDLKVRKAPGEDQIKNTALKLLSPKAVTYLLAITLCSGLNAFLRHERHSIKTQYCALPNKSCPSEHSVLTNNRALPRSHSFKLLGISITESMIWHEHVSSIATAAGKKFGYLFRARKYFSPSNLLTLYKAQITHNLEYCSHIWGAATLSILDAVQRRAI